MREYRQRYWERFRETHKRVYGTLTLEEYAAFQQRAESAGRAVWAQIQAEAEAYARREYLPPQEIEVRLSELVVQLRRIGNNVNQIAHTLHGDGTLRASDLARSLDELERLVRHFVRQPWAQGQGDDDEPPGA
ncbi:hypothetical protein JCM17961_50280 [Endothiovibrio diazotrophicus]